MQNLNLYIKQQNALTLAGKTQRGFTLLEVMLVIVIMATVVVFSIGIFQQQAINAQIDKTSLQMQQWLEAAKAYYVDNADWPNGNNFIGQGQGIPCVAAKPGVDRTVLLLEGKCGPLVQNNKVYIQSGVSIENDAWGQPFVLLPPAKQTNQNSNMFQVVSSVPANLKNALTIANRLAARLPNATVGAIALNGSPLSVTAGVTIPGSASNDANQVKIVSIQDINCDGINGCPSIPEPFPGTCPTGTAPAMHVALQQYHNNQYMKYSFQLAALDAGPVNNGTSNDTWPKTPSIIRGGPVKQVAAYGGSLLVIITCEKPQANNAKINLPYSF